ncbi:hypothetical protein XELAEV_18006371mg [Xenopus laevis]|uniref:Uncharacterized protein n=1 Tax=Xenopus laevis TaxID=8355 RepID=A0A974I3H3_XENLA|nr:hypothetical protein XELAEV_18006371mg [Xenopus laevis]
MHIFWSCPDLSSFWLVIIHACSQILGRNAPVSLARTLLFSDEETKEGVPEFTLERHLLNAAKILIPKLRKSSNPPTSKNWIDKVNEIVKFEELSTVSGNQYSKFRDIWL